MTKIVDGAGLLRPICCATLVVTPLVVFLLQSEVVVDDVNETMSKIEALLSTWLTKMKLMMLAMLRTSDGLKPVVAIEDVDVDPSCPKHFTGTTIVDDCSTGGRDVVVYFIYVVLPVVVVIFLASRLSSSNRLLEVDSDELDEYSYNRFVVSYKLVVVC